MESTRQRPSAELQKGRPASADVKRSRPRLHMATMRSLSAVRSSASSRRRRRRTNEGGSVDRRSGNATHGRSKRERRAVASKWTRGYGEIVNTHPLIKDLCDPAGLFWGKVDIGALRTYPEGYTPPGASANQYQSIPLEKIEDFGVHADQYYSLNVEVFTSSKDTTLLGALWNKYWVNTLSQSPLISVRFLFFLGVTCLLNLIFLESCLCSLSIG